MSTTHHTAITTGAAANAAVINSPLGELDAAIVTEAAARVAADAEFTNALVGVFNVLDYGAVGDGATDDATAIQAAIDAAEAAGGGTVVLPKGTFAIGTVLTVGADNIHIRGGGHGSIIQTIGAVATGIDLTGRQLCTVSHLDIYTATTTNPWRGIYLGPGAWNNFLQDVYISANTVHTGQIGVMFSADDGSLGGSYWNTLVNVIAMHLDIGFDLDVGTRQCNDNHFIACQARDGKTGFRLGSTGAANGNHIIGCTCDGYDVVGIEVGANSCSNVVQGCYLEGDAGSVPVNFKAGCRDNTFSGLVLASTTGRNVITDAGTRNSWDAVVVDPTDAAIYSERRDSRRQRALLLKPIANAGEVLQIQKADGTVMLDFSTNSTPRLELPNGANLLVYSDGFSTQTFAVVGASGDVNSAGIYKVDGTQVVGARVIDARASAVANSGDGTTDGLIDALRDAMIAHGLLAAA